MCKVWLIYYTCGHKLTECLSKCRATYKTQSAPGKAFYPACQGTASLCIDFKRLCGDCASRNREEELNEKRTRLAPGTSERLKADEEYAHESFVMSKNFPRLEHKRSLKPLTIHLPTRETRGSLLKTEVLREDIEGDISEMESWQAYYDEWRTEPSYASGANAETAWWESEDVNETTQSAANGWANDDVFGFDETSVDAWAADDGWATDDGNTLHAGLASAWAWGGEDSIDDPSTKHESEPALETLNQPDNFHTNGDWIEQTAEKMKGSEQCKKEIQYGEKGGKHVAFCVLIDSLNRSCSERLWLGSAMV